MCWHNFSKTKRSPINLYSVVYFPNIRLGRFVRFFCYPIRSLSFTRCPTESNIGRHIGNNKYCRDCKAFHIPSNSMQSMTGQQNILIASQQCNLDTPVYHRFPMWLRGNCSVKLLVVPHASLFNGTFSATGYRQIFSWVPVTWQTGHWVSTASYGH